MEKIKNWLKNNLSEERYRHSISTANMAIKLAKELNCNMQKAELAGLLHDCAKEIKYEKMLQIVKENDLQNILNISEDELNTPKVLHAPLSAYLAETIFGIKDIEILSAIRFHTIGKIGMSDFEKLIFLADKLETETRTEKCFEILRKEFESTKSLDKTLFLCSKMTINSLLERNLQINYTSVNLYNDLLKKQI